MWRKSSSFLLLNYRRVTTSALLKEAPPPVSASIPSDNFSYCMSLLKFLNELGRVDDARKVTGRVINGCSSVPEVVSVLNFAVNSGIGLDSGCSGALLSKLTQLGNPTMAENPYRATVIGNGIVPDLSILNSMVTCLLQLGKFDEARDHFDRIIKSECVPSTSACNAILGELLEQDRNLEAFEYFVRLNEMGMRQHLWCCEKLFKGLCGQGHLEEATEMLSPICDLNGTPLPVNVYKTFFYGLCRKGWYENAEELLYQMEADGYFIDKVMYTCLMKEYCNNKDMTMAIRVFLRMLKTGCEPDKYVFNTLIHGFVKAGMFENGWMFFIQMIKMGMDPDAFTYNMMISSFCEQGNVEYAVMLLDSMALTDVSPNAHCYNNLIATLGRNNKLDIVEKLYMDILEHGVPDHILFFTFSKIFPEEFILEMLAVANLQAIVKNGCGIDPSSMLEDVSDMEAKIEPLLEIIAENDANLAVSGLAIVTTALCARGNCSDALDYMDKMVNLGYKPLLFSYNSVIKCLCRDGLFEDSKSLLNQMRERGILPDSDTYLIMVHEYCRRDEVKSAIDLVFEMEEEGLKPTVAIYKSVIRCLGRQGRVFEAENMFLRMLESGIEPDEIVYHTLIHVYARNKSINEACELSDTMAERSISLDRYSYTSLISGLVKKNMTDVAIVYIDKMMGEGFHPDLSFFHFAYRNLPQEGRL